MSSAHRLIEDLASTKKICLNTLVQSSQAVLQTHQTSQGAITQVGKKTKSVFAYLLKVCKFLLGWLAKPENWLMKRTWIGALILLRCAYLAMNEYGYNPFKKQLKGDHVFLTGAGGGLGRLMAIRLGKLGCKLSLSDVNMAGLQETKAEIEKEGVASSNIAIFVCDVSKSSSIKQGATVARAAFGPVTILINNAGIVSGKTTLELSDAMIEKTLQVNTIAILHTTREFLPDMIKGKRGHLVTIASMAGLTSVPGLSDYCASKHGAVAVDESVRLELSQKGLSGFIKTTCICPYFINTGMFDGAKQAWPFYILSPIEVTDRIIAAIQQEEEKVVIPFRGNVINILKLMPVSIADKISNALGVNNAMSDFKGKGTMEQRIPGLNGNKQ